MMAILLTFSVPWLLPLILISLVHRDGARTFFFSSVHLKYALNSLHYWWRLVFCVLILQTFQASKYPAGRTKSIIGCGIVSRNSMLLLFYQFADTFVENNPVDRLALRSEIGGWKPVSSSAGVSSIVSIVSTPSVISGSTSNVTPSELSRTFAGTVPLQSIETQRCCFLGKIHTEHSLRNASISLCTIVPSFIGINVIIIN